MWLIVSRMHVRNVALSILAAVCLLAFTTACRAQEARLDLVPSFSLDGGKTWSSDFPILEKPGKILMRVSWSNARPPGQDDVYTTALCCEQADFASANVGHQDWDNHSAWHQRPVPYWLESKGTHFDYELDLGSRPAGRMGYVNVWDGKRFVDGPLGACEALKPGTWKFTVTVSYWLKKTNPDRLVVGRSDFFVTIGQKAPAAPPAATIAAKPLTLDSQAMDIGHGDLELPATAGELFDSSGPLRGATREKDLALLNSGQEIRWIVREPPATKCTVGVLMSLAQPPYVPAARLYVDGKAGSFKSARAPGQVDIGGRPRWLAEAISEPVELRAGSEVRLVVTEGASRIGRLALYKTLPPRGPMDLQPLAQPAYDDKVRITGAIELPVNRSDKAVARAQIINVLPQAVQVTVTARVFDFFQQVQADTQQQVTLEPRKPLALELPFAWGASERYKLIVDAKVADGSTVSAVFDRFADAVADGRARVWLSGPGQEWQYLSLGEATTLQPPPAGTEAKWGKAILPGRSPGPENKKENCGWFRRTFTVPGWMPGQRKILHLERVSFEGQVVLNGKTLGTQTGWHCSFDLDVTDVLKPGTNELLVGLRGGIAALIAEEQAKGGPIDSQRKVAWPGFTDRISMGDVWLGSRPAGGVDDVTVETSFRKKNLTVQIAMANLQAGPLTLKNTVYFNGKQVLALPDRPVTTADRTVRVSQAWPEPILWGLGQPNLLRLDTEVVDQQGKRLDLVHTRFGFRELWAQDARLYFNGVPTNFRAYAMNDDWGWTERMQLADIRSRVRSGLHFLGTMERHVYGTSSHYEMADEEGIPVACGVSGEAGPTQFKLESDLLWQNTETLAIRRIKQLRNHPSIVQWYLSNEYSETAPDPVLATRRLVALRDACAKADTTRIFEAGCDLDLRGALDITCTHYPVDIGGLRDANCFLPDAALWHPRGEEMVKGMKAPAGQVKRVANVHGESPLTWGTKPLIINETGWNYFYAPLFGYTILMGDEVFRSPVSAGEAHVRANEYFMAGHRDAQASVITPWHHHVSGAIGRTLAPLAIFPTTRTCSWYGGTEVQWDVDVFHDNGKSQTLALEWSLQGSGAGGKLPEVHYEPYSLSRQKVRIAVPSVPQDRSDVLVLRLVDQAEQVQCSSQFSVRLAAPMKATVDAPLRVGLIDPAGKTKAATERIGIKAAAVVAPTSEALQGFDLVIIGEEAMSDEAVSKAGKALAGFVEAGGRLLCLRQEKFAGGLFTELGNPVSGQAASQVWRRSPHHPVLAGLEDADLHFWFPDHVVGRGGVPKPAGSQARTLIDCGNANVGLDLALLVELRLGKGRAMVSQLMFADRAGQCPPADRLVATMIGYLSKPAPAARPCALLAPAGSPLEGSLKALMANLQPCDLKAMGQYQSIIVDAASLANPGNVHALNSYLQAGGSVLLHGATNEHKAAMAELAGSEVRVVTPNPPGFSGRAILEYNDPLTDGLSNQDLFWRRQPDSENQGASFTEKDYRVGEPLTCAYQGPAVQGLSYPAGLASVTVGKGRLYLDAVRWDIAPGEVKVKAQRLAATMLSNLGVTFSPRAARVALSGLQYRTIDISRYLNRGLTDEVAGDGKGGWTDQGPDSDLRTLPVGRRDFAGVPFEIGSPMSCLVLGSKYSAPGAPKAVEGMKIGGKVDALYFLQSSAYTTRGLHAKYVVHYADGQTAEIALEGNINYRDWAATDPNDPFPFETSTLTQAGWTGKGRHFGKVSVYVMEWVNPRPAVEIAAFDFVSAENGIPVLLGVTTGMKASDADEAMVKGDTAAASTLDAQAKDASARGDIALAVKLAKMALGKDATYIPARVRLADLLEQTGQTRQALEHLHKVIRINPQHLESYLRIGAIHEKAQQWDEAMKIYQASLQANPNQPLVMQAMERVKKQKR